MLPSPPPAGASSPDREVAEPRSATRPTGRRGKEETQTGAAQVVGGRPRRAAGTRPSLSSRAPSTKRPNQAGRRGVGGAGPAGGGGTGRWPVLGASCRPRGGSDPDEVTGKHRLPMARAGFPHRARETRPRDTHLSWQPSRPGPMQLWEEEEEHTCRSLSPLTLFLRELLGNRKAVCVRLLSSTEITLQLSLGEVVNPSFIMHLFICVFARQLVLSVYAVTEIVPAPNKVSFWSSSRNRFHYDFDTGVAVPQRALHCFFHR